MKSKPQRSVKSAYRRSSSGIVRAPAMHQRGESDEDTRSVPRADSALGCALARRILAAEAELVEKLRSGFAAVVIAVPNADMVLPLGDGLRRAVFADCPNTDAADRWVPNVRDGRLRTDRADHGNEAVRHARPRESEPPAPIDTPRPTEPGEKALQGGPRSERLVQSANSTHQIKVV
jgi:hypothetical protein